MTSASDKSQANKQLVRRHIDLSWNDADFEALDQVWAPDCVVHLPTGQTIAGLGALQDHLRSAVLYWSDRRCEIEALVSEGDTVANRWTFRGTAGGETVTIAGMDFYRMSDGLIVEEWIALGSPQSMTAS